MKNAAAQAFCPVHTAHVAYEPARREGPSAATADQIRDELTEAGITLEDTAEGTKWRRD